MSGDLKKRIKAVFPGLLCRENVSYKELTTLGVGASLPLLLEPNAPEELAKLLKFLTSSGIPYFIFGGGSNVIGMDTPYNGAGIRLAGAEFSKIEVRDDRFICGGRAPANKTIVVVKTDKAFTLALLVDGRSDNEYHRFEVPAGGGEFLI